MIEFGKTLRASREAKGLTTSEVAQKTHMLVQQVEALEKEDFSKIAAPIYGRGFVKLYCEAVGITDYKPLIDEFMDIYSGNKPPTIRMKTVVSNDTPVTETPDDISIDSDAFSMSDGNEAENSGNPDNEIEDEETSLTDENSQQSETFVDFSASPEITESEPVNDEPPSPPPDNLFDFALASEKPRQEKPKGVQNAAVTASDFFNDTDGQSASLPHKSQGPSRYSTPKPLEYNDKSRFDIPPVVWRIGLLAIIAIFVLWLIIAGISALYRATLPSEETASTNEDVSETATSDSGEKTPSSNSSKRTPMKIQPLYMNFNN